VGALRRGGINSTLLQPVSGLGWLHHEGKNIMKNAPIELVSTVQDRLQLYVVTLDWPDSGTGDFCESAWAENEYDAIRQVAERMEDLGSGLTDDDEEERRQWIEDVIARAGPYAAEDALPRVLEDLTGLLRGPEQAALTNEQSALLDAIRAQLGRKESAVGVG
jgi:hypothetical protein